MISTPSKRVTPHAEIGILSRAAVVHASSFRDILHNSRDLGANATLALRIHI